MSDTPKEVHTPGPWKVERENHNRTLRGADGKSLMCDEQYYPWTPDSDADWELIGAAPEMLKALECIENALCDGIGHISRNSVEHLQLKFAIQKARGVDNPFHPFKDAAEYIRTVLSFFAPTIEEQLKEQTERALSFKEELRRRQR